MQYCVDENLTKSSSRLSLSEKDDGARATFTQSNISNANNFISDSTGLQFFPKSFKNNRSFFLWPRVYFLAKAQLFALMLPQLRICIYRTLLSIVVIVQILIINELTYLQWVYHTSFMLTVCRPTLLKNEVVWACLLRTWKVLLKIFMRARDVCFQSISLISLQLAFYASSTTLANWVPVFSIKCIIRLAEHVFA